MPLLRVQRPAGDAVPETRTSPLAGMGIWPARLLVFASSAAVLVIEIIAGRRGAPYVGVSLQTFTGIIGVVLAGVAGGAWLGGWLADRLPPRALLGPTFLVSGVLALAIPMIIDGLGPFLRAGRPFHIVVLTAASLLLPALLLSAVPPMVTKLRLRSLTETGTVVGSLSAVSTAGALIGTFVTGFVFVAAFPTRPIVLALGVTLALVGLALMRSALSSRSMLAGSVLMVAAAVSIGRVPGPCQYQTEYFCAVVEVDAARPSGRTLYLDSLTHSYVDLDDPTYLRLNYSQNIADVVRMLPDGPIDAVYIGGGGFTLPRYVRAVRPGSRATVLEIDGALVRLVERDLGLVRSDDLRVAVGDARLELPRHAARSTRLVIGDAFGGLSVPWHLTTREFIEQIDATLAPDGMYVLNVIDYPPLGFARAEVATLGAVFEHVAVVASVQHLLGYRGGNFILVGSHQPLPWERIQAALAERGQYVSMDASAREFAAGAEVLRDDHAPVDQLLTYR